MDERTQQQVPDRKQDHIELAMKAGMANKGADHRFSYEPMLTPHPADELDISVSFIGKKMNAPVWVSSMTGGTEMAFDINHRLATTCARFGLGMGLGSCRPLLENLSRLKDFDIRNIIGPDLPLYANLGIAQVESLFASGRTDNILQLVEELKADGLILHVNPLQEWLQPEGDTILKPPIETLRELLEIVPFPVIVKEVGQGMGEESIKAILKEPVAAFELASHGGTNFSKLELLRSNDQMRDTFSAISRIGHTVEDMVNWINTMSTGAAHEIKCRQIIVSGGINDFLDGYYWTQKLKLPSVYGQASAFLKYARESQEALDEFVAQQIKGLQLAHTYLRVN